MKKLNAFVSGILIFLFALVIRLYNILTFDTIDEGKWFYQRVPQFIEALINFDFAATFISDKPGIINGWVSGISYLIATKFFGHDYPIIVLSMRVSQVIIVSISIVIIYIVLKSLFGTRIAIVSTLIVILDPILIENAQILNPDAYVSIFSLISILYFLEHILKKKRWSLSLSALFLSFALLSKYSAQTLLLYYLILYFILWCYNFKSTTEIVKEIIMVMKIVFISFLMIWPAVWRYPLLIFRNSIDFAGLIKYNEHIFNDDYLLFSYILVVFSFIVLFTGLKFCKKALSESNLKTIINLFERIRCCILNIKGYFSNHEKTAIWFVRVILFFYAGLILFVPQGPPAELPFHGFTDTLVYSKSNMVGFENAPLIIQVALNNMNILKYSLNELQLLFFVGSIFWISAKASFSDLKSMVPMALLFYILFYQVSVSAIMQTAEPKYQIQVYGVLYVLVGILIVKVIEYILNKVNINKSYFYTLTIITFFLIFIGMSFKWYEYGYLRVNNFSDRLAFDGWGEGGYEAADFLNSYDKDISEKTILTNYWGLHPFINTKNILGKIGFTGLSMETYTFYPFEYLVDFRCGYRIKELEPLFEKTRSEFERIYKYEIDNNELVSIYKNKGLFFNASLEVPIPIEDVIQRSTSNHLNEDISDALLIIINTALQSEFESEVYQYDKNKNAFENIDVSSEIPMRIEKEIELLLRKGYYDGQIIVNSKESYNYYLARSSSETEKSVKKVSITPKVGDIDVLNLHVENMFKEHINNNLNQINLTKKTEINNDVNLLGNFVKIVCLNDNVYYVPLMDLPFDSYKIEIDFNRSNEINYSQLINVDYFNEKKNMLKINPIEYVNSEVLIEIAEKNKLDYKVTKEAKLIVDEHIDYILEDAIISQKTIYSKYDGLYLRLLGYNIEENNFNKNRVLVNMILNTGVKKAVIAESVAIDKIGDYETAVYFRLPHSLIGDEEIEEIELLILKSEDSAIDYLSSGWVRVLNSAQIDDAAYGENYFVFKFKVDELKEYDEIDISGFENGRTDVIVGNTSLSFEKKDKISIPISLIDFSDTDLSIRVIHKNQIESSPIVKLISYEQLWEENSNVYLVEKMFETLNEISIIENELVIDEMNFNNNTLGLKYSTAYANRYAVKISGIYDGKPFTTEMMLLDSSDKYYKYKEIILNSYLESFSCMIIDLWTNEIVVEEEYEKKINSVFALEKNISYCLEKEDKKVNVIYDDAFMKINSRLVVKPFEELEYSSTSEYFILVNDKKLYFVETNDNNVSVYGENKLLSEDTEIYLEFDKNKIYYQNPNSGFYKVYPLKVSHSSENKDYFLISLIDKQETSEEDIDLMFENIGKNKLISQMKEFTNLNIGLLNSNESRVKINEVTDLVTSNELSTTISTLIQEHNDIKNFLIKDLGNSIVNIELNNLSESIELKVELPNHRGDHYSNNGIVYKYEEPLLLTKDSILTYRIKANESSNLRVSVQAKLIDLEGNIHYTWEDDILDNNGLSINYKENLNPYFVRNWLFRSFELSDYEGYSIEELYIMINDEPEQLVGGIYEFQLDDIRITDKSSTVKLKEFELLLKRRVESKK